MKHILLVAAFALPASAQMQHDAHPGDAAGMHQQKPAASLSTQLTVTAGAAPITLTLADLQSLPQQTVTVHNAHTNADETYTGPLVSDVLAKAGLALSDKTEHPMLRMYLVAGGTDKYWVLYFAAEVQPGLHTAKVIVAIAKSSQPLGVNGQFQLLDNMDVKPARWVRNLNSLTIRTATE